MFNNVFLRILMVCIFTFLSSNCFCMERDKSDGIEEIIITADKRKEKLQDSPSIVTAFTESYIEDAGIKNIDDVVDYIPNMNFNSSHMVGLNQVNFRGIHMSAFTEKNPVVIFIDGIPQDNLSYFGTDLINIERVEVLRGTQGTIYGKNAIGGVINIVSKKPGNESESKVAGEIGENKTYGIKGYTNGSIIKDRLFYGLSGGYHETQGYMKNKNSGDDYFDGEESFNLNSRLRFIPSDRSEINFHAGLTENNYESGVSISPYEGVKYHSNKNPDDHTDADNMSSALKYDYNGQWYDFKSISTYSFSQVKGDQDQIFVNPGKMSVISTRDNDIQAFSQELRIKSKDDDNDNKVKWLGGIFYSRETLKYNKLGKEYKTGKMLGYDLLYNWSDDIN